MRIDNNFWYLLVTLMQYLIMKRMTKMAAIIMCSQIHYLHYCFIILEGAQKVR